MNAKNAYAIRSLLVLRMTVLGWTVADIAKVLSKSKEDIRKLRARGLRLKAMKLDDMFKQTGPFPSMAGYLAKD